MGFQGVSIDPLGRLVKSTTVPEQITQGIPPMIHEYSHSASPDLNIVACLQGSLARV